MEEEVQKAGSDRKKEKVMEKITKNKFLSMLKGSSVSNVEMGQKQEIQEKVCYILEVAYNVGNMIYQKYLLDAISFMFSGENIKSC